MIEGAIFDLDGTLLDSMQIWDNMGEIYLRSLGLEPRDDINEKFLLLSLRESAEFYIREYGVGLTVDEITSGINALAARFYREEAETKEGVYEFLSELRGRGVKMCVATATDRPQVEAALKRCGIRDFFSEIFTCTEVGSGKSAPDIFRRAVSHLGTKKEKTVVFEDSLFAVKTAKRDSFNVVGIKDSHQRGRDEIRALSDVFLDGFTDCKSFWDFAESL